MFKAKTAFEARVTNNHNDDLANITGKYQDTRQDEACSAGFLCTTDKLMPNQGYGNVTNENAYIMKKATAEDLVNVPIYAANTYDVNLVEDPVTGNQYAVGANTLGLPIPKGRVGTFTHINFDGTHKYLFGIGNLTTEPESNKFLTIQDGFLLPAGSAPVGNMVPYFEIEATGTFTEGTANAFGWVLVRARYSIAAA